MTLLNREQIARLRYEADVAEVRLNGQLERDANDAALRAARGAAPKDISAMTGAEILAAADDIKQQGQNARYQPPAPALDHDFGQMSKEDFEAVVMASRDGTPIHGTDLSPTNAADITKTYISGGEADSDDLSEPNTGYSDAAWQEGQADGD